MAPPRRVVVSLVRLDLLWQKARGVDLKHALLLSTAAFLALLSGWATYVHVDDTDAGLYRTVVRNMAADGTWFDLRYLPSVYPGFREHLPFGFWPYAAVQRVHDAGPVVLAWLFSLATLAVLARRSLLAAFLLGTLSSSFELAATVRLDHLLVLATTAGGLALLELPPAGTPGQRWRWVWIVLCAAVGVAVKGPFGLVPLGAIALTRAIAERRPAVVFGAAGAGLVALAGPAVLLFASWRAGGDWYSGYVQGQLLPSATGARLDGSSSVLAPWLTIGTRFWPWLPLALWGLWQTARRRELRVLAASILLMLLVLGLPGRKVWNHALIVFPFLCLWLARSLDLTRFESLRRPAAWTLGGLTAVALLVIVVVRPDLGRCVVPPEAVRFSREQPPERLAVVRPKVGSPWKPLAILAGEYQTVPRLVDSLEDAAAHGCSAVLTRDEAPEMSCSGGAGWRWCRLPGTGTGTGQ